MAFRWVIRYIIIGLASSLLAHLIIKRITGHIWTALVGPRSRGKCGVYFGSNHRAIYTHRLV